MLYFLKMRTVCTLIIALCLSLCLYSRDRAYSGKEKREAIRGAYELLKVYYPDSLCVADSIYDLEWHVLTDVDEKTQEVLRDKVGNGHVRTAPVYSKFLHRTFPEETCDDCDGAYVFLPLK